ncbi:hypothetical protein GFJ99_11670 [Flavobacterium sp. LMO6]|uniref:N-terminal domain-containing protein n=1 Tax=Flavobacterium phage vB_FspS_laban6-1 TaxID=2686250 RepID=A0A6B9LAB3_9CAUD|nr:ArdC-like ssDNA-binding domain-containing protein [Flavobacterium sp. LMO6]YP_009854824.1 ssDNA-binding domain-containing protein [Flavobacterium phage vB_FspS_laban6-1]MQP63353.1 hypothetical protein [Flavobacterium sp. LMO6]QHB38997.1 hypothetical protein laban61_gp026 [Flavobacterium phage vB_FspS_laban6-1]
METQTTEHKELTKREELRELSKIAKMFQNTSCAEMTINEILIEHFYKSEEHKEFKTLHDWNKEGFKVNKGEKAFLIWGKPKKNQKNENPDKQEPEDETEFYPICFLFSNAQVTKK